MKKDHRGSDDVKPSPRRNARGRGERSGVFYAEASPAVHRCFLSTCLVAIVIIIYAIGSTGTYSHLARPAPLTLSEQFVATTAAHAAGPAPQFITNLTYVFIAGVEGSGHHAMMSALELPSAAPLAPCLVGRVDQRTGAHLYDWNALPPECRSPSSQSDAASPTSALAAARSVHDASNELWRNRDAAGHRTRQAALDASLTTLVTARAADRNATWRLLVGPFTISSDGPAPLSYPFGVARDSVRHRQFLPTSSSPV